MPSHDAGLKEVESRLLSLVRVVLDKAKDDTEFAERLKTVLLSDELRASVSARATRKKRQIFDHVGVLSTQGSEGLRRALTDMANSDLADLIRAHKGASAKRLKTMERDEMINLLVTHAERKLGQGSAFLGTIQKTDITDQ